jgi:hypothetical protein
MAVVECKSGRRRRNYFGLGGVGPPQLPECKENEAENRRSKDVNPHFWYQKSDLRKSLAVMLA